VRPAAARRARHGGRGLSGERYELPPERLARWLERWAAAHGGLASWAGGDGGATVTLTGADGALLDCEPPFPPFPPFRPPTGLEAGDAIAAALVAHAARERTVGVLLVRLGGHAAGVFAGTRLTASKTGARLVHGRHRAGGSSSGRFARRRAGQARVALEAAAGVAVHVLRAPAERGELDAVVTGGDRSALTTVLEDPRLQSVRALAVDRVLDVPDPRRAVLEATPEAFRATVLRPR
jgi:peptide subunit release factor 1 (eRF1)